MIVINYNKHNYIIDKDLNINGKDKNFIEDLKIIIKNILVNYDTSKGFQISYIAQYLENDYNMNIIYVDDEEKNNSQNNLLVY